MRSSADIWRLIRSTPQRGAMNMAIDETLLEQVASAASPPLLRLYSWQPACLSLGQAQPLADVDHAALADEGWDLVRRPTGGRAILHTDELTYAVIAPLEDPHVRGTLLESYLKISRALTRSLEQLGLEVVAREDPDASQVARSKNPVCFEEPSSYEIVIAGRKIIGSAQARRAGVLLQHGALPLRGDLARITRALAFSDGTTRARAAEKLLTRALTVETALGRPVSWEQAAEAFTTGFRSALEIDFQEEALTPAEGKRAEELRREKYAADTWTRRC